MRFIHGFLLASALIVHEAAAKPLAATSSTTETPASSATPVCGRAYKGFQVSCGQTFSGNVVHTSSQSSIQDCIASCSDTKSCIAVSFLSGQCTLLSSVSDIANADGALAAIEAGQAVTVLPSIGSSIMSSAASSISASEVAPTATTTSLPYGNELEQHLSQRLSDNSPSITGEQPQISISVPSTAALSSASSTSSSTEDSASGPSATTPPSRVKRAANSCTASNVVSNMSVIKAARPSPVIFCESWNVGRPHASSGFTKIAYPQGVGSACACILSSYAAATTCSESGIQSNMAVIQAQPTPTMFCESWMGSRPHDQSSVSGIEYAVQVTNACKCMLAGAVVKKSASTSKAATSTVKSSTSKTSSLSTATTGAFVKNTGKRGLAYNDASLTLPFSRAGQNSKVSWAYNWYLSQSTTGFNPALEFVPLLYNNDSTLLKAWPTAAQDAIDNGATALFSMNEPDWCASGSACMTVSSVVTTYKKYMQPFAGKALLGAPAVTNAGSPYGLTYLKNFINNCTGCTIDFINLHWYSNKYAGATYFEEYINSARAIANGRPIWITEFGLDSTYSYTQTELQAFLEKVMPWMDQQSDIHRYAYFMDAAGILINSNGVGISATGAVFNSFTNSTVQQDLY